MVLPVACLSAGLLGRPRRRDTLGPFLHGAFVIQRQNWSRRLPRPLLIPDVMVLATVADVRELMRHLPSDRRIGRHGARSLQTLKLLLPAAILRARLSGCGWCCSWSASNAVRSEATQ